MAFSSYLKMIKTNTLFILGAGASKPFGYPTGIELRESIITVTKEKEIVQSLGGHVDVHNDRVQLYEFINAFKGSGVYSIDSFLEYRPEYMYIGKMAIAASLIEKEVDNHLRTTEGNWYMYLFDRIKVSFEKLDQNNISFITFNYDRSLEQFLFEAIRNLFGKKPEECAEKIEKIPIVHLYGQLHPLPWQEESGIMYSPNKRLIKRLKTAPITIKIISDEREVDSSEEFQKAYKLVKDARRIYFLGFGFDETNLKRLKISLMKEKMIWGTALGLETSKYNWVTEYFQAQNTGIVLHKGDALSLLQESLKIE